MESLKTRITSLKKIVQKKKEESELLSEVLKKILASVFLNKKVLRYLKTFYVKNNFLFVETTNKSFAQEISLKKNEVLQKMKENKVVLRDIIVR